MLSYRPVGANQMVIGVLTYYLPQHQHPAPSVLATRSLALLATYKANQQTTSERGLQEADSSIRPCNAPSATPAATLQCRHSAAMGLASWKKRMSCIAYVTVH